MATNDTMNQPIAGGLSAKQWVELLCTPKAHAANKALNYLDGDQEKEMIKLLSDPQRGRKAWQEKGIIPRFRNVTKAVVEKSGRLFQDMPPMLEVYEANGTEEDESQSLKLAQLLNNTEWVEVFTNLDIVVRLLKTAVLLVQWNTDEDRLTFDILHRGNCAVVLEPNSRRVNSMIYKTSCDGETSTYRVMTNEQYIDLVDIDDKIQITGMAPNPYGMVPVVEFYDTGIPRAGYWVDGGYDLIAMNEIVNLHVTDAEYAISWAKLPSLMTNMRFDNAGTDSWETTAGTPSAADPLGRRVVADSSIIGGPSRVLQLDSAGVDSPFIKYESPRVDISPMDSVIEGWVKAYAADWSVNVHIAGEGRAQSGFTLVVEEIDNLTLRKQRQRMFEAGFKRFFQVIKKIVPGMFTETSILFAEFSNPILPVNPIESEQAWSLRIAEGRGTTVDYFIEMKGLSEKEADEKWRETIEWQKENAALRGEPVDPETPEPLVTPQDTADPLQEPENLDTPQGE